MSDSLGPYEILEQIGEGGMGVVYRGRNSSTGEAVAVKTARLDSRQALTSLRSEIEALARIAHPSIVRIVDHGAKDGVPWYAMEYLEGETWADYNIILWPPPVAMGDGPTARRYAAVDEATVPRRGRRAAASQPADDVAFDDTIRYASRPDGLARPRPEIAAGQLAEVLTRARQLCTALIVLHEAGFVHRDLKPANVFLVDGRPVLTDLGIASRYRGAVGRERIEVSGRLIGTVRYMAPEQAQGSLVDARADLFAFGMMLFETLTGRLPFSASTTETWLQAIMHEPAPKLASFAQGAPKALEELLSSLLAPEPRDRIGHADDVARVLESVGAAPDPMAPKTTRMYLYRPAMAGREAPRLMLEQALGRARRSGGELVVIGGESGVGKTVLATELARAAVLDGFTVITGECLPIALGAYTAIDVQSSPLHPLRPLLEHAVDLVHAGGGPTTGELLRDGRGKLLSAYEPSLGQLPGVAEQTVQDLPGELAQRRLIRAVRDLLTALVADTGPFLLLLDDLQWADQVTLTVLQALVEAGLAETKVLIVCTFRSDEIQPGLAALLDAGAVRRINLERLDASSVRSMISDMLAMRRPPPGFVDFLTDKSEGNPFFVAEYLRLAAADGILKRQQGRWTFAAQSDTPEAYAQLDIPASLEELVTRRLSGLSEASRRLLEVASVLGRETDRRLLSAVSRLDPDALDAALQPLVLRQVLEADGGRFRFGHDKLRETAYDRIEEAQRRALNRDAAVACEKRATEGDEPLDDGRLAHFWTEAEEWPKAVDALERAAERALAEYANEQAIRTYTNLFDICERERIDVGATRRGQWSRGLADASFALGRDFQGRRHIEQALAHLGQPNLPMGGFAQGLAMLREVAGLTLQAYLSPLFRVRAGLARIRTAEAALAYNRLLEHMLRNNETVLAVYANLRNVRLAERVPPRPALARGWAMLSYVACLTPLQGLAAKWARRAVEIARGLDSDATVVYATSRVMAYQVTVGRWSEAEASYSVALELAKSIGDKKQEEEAYLTYAVGLFVEGRFERRVEVLEACLESARARGDGRFVTFARSGLVECYARLGQDAALRPHLAELQNLPAGEREQSEAIWAHGAAALGAWSVADESAARGEADRALSLMRETPPQVFLLTPPLWEICELYLELAEARADATDADAMVVRRHLSEVVRLFDAFAKLIRCARPLAGLARAGWSWRQGKAARALSQWRAALAEAEALGARHAEARAHYELGRHLEDAGRRDHLERAVAGFEAVGAAPELARARSALASGRVAP